MAPTTLVFVYGSLKRGFALHSLLAAQRFAGRAVTSPLYRMFDLGDYPGMVDWQPGNSIEGELYGVTEQCLRVLDDAEGVDEGLYVRKPVQLHNPIPATSVFAWFYAGSVDGLPDCGTHWP